VLNDAVAITLFKTTSKYVGSHISVEDGLIAFADFIVTCIGSTVVGFGLGMLSAWIFKVVDLSQHRLLLVSLFVGMVYVPFLLSGRHFQQLFRCKKL
jgi:NhaP-type Na+/H+ or K+/H+ antiporter